MPIPHIQQPTSLLINENLRLRAFDGQAELAFDWYQEPDVIYLIDGSREPYSLERIQRMYDYLEARGEVYFIEVLEHGRWLAIGDVTFWQQDMPIIIGHPAYRGRGLGSKVLSALIERGRMLGYDRLEVQEIYDYNLASQRLFEGLGFYPTSPKDKGSVYALDLTLPLAAIQPSQFYLSEDKLARLDLDFEAGELGPLPVKRLDGQIFFTDGHSRAYKAFQAGLETIPVYYDSDPLNWDFYRHCVQACQDRGVFSIGDLKDRILSQEAYQSQWLDWCQKEAEKYEAD